MDAPIRPRDVPRHHVATVEARHPLRIVGILPRGSAAHRFEDDAPDLRAERRDGLSLFGLAGAENDPADLLGRPVGIVLPSGREDREAVACPKLAQSL